jgi:hypothetical protein
MTGSNFTLLSITQKFVILGLSTYCGIATQPVIPAKAGIQDKKF